MQGLDKHITGNFGEASAPAEFVTGDAIGELAPGTWIYVTPQTAESWIVARVKEVVEDFGRFFIFTEELAYPLVVNKRERVYLADEEQPEGEAPCTCADAGDCFAPAGHYADCPQPERCANCGIEVENRGDLSMDGNHHVRWVHARGGYAICYPQQPDSPRAVPKRTDGN